MSKFITIEGSEGVGKSTALRGIQEYLESREVDFILTREPGGTPIAETIRRILLTKFDETMDPKAELLLMFASRIQHVNGIIKPALAQGKTVICDRFMDASYAYQGGGRQLGLECVRELDKWLDIRLQPDLTLLLDAPIDVGFSRLEKNRERDRIEQEELAFFERVIASYRTLAKQHPERFVLIDATKDIAQVRQDITTALEKIL